MKKEGTGYHNPILYLKRGFRFPVASANIKSSFRGENFRITTSKEKIKVFVPQAPGGSGTTTFCPNYFWMTYGPVNSMEVRDVFINSLEIADTLSLFTKDFYFDNAILPIYFLPGGLSANVPLVYPSEYAGIQIESENGALIIDNQKIESYFLRINHLTIEDYSYFRSAIHLLREAKKHIYVGEDSAAITAAVSAVEALYTRSNSQGFFGEIDPRFKESRNLKKGKKADNFQKVFIGGGGVQNWQKLYGSFQSDPYAIRSGYLHSGKLLFYFGANPDKRQDNFVDFILRCQEVIRESLVVFGV